METNMPKKTKSLAVRDKIEVLGPTQPDTKGALERMVERKIAEMMGDSQDGIFEPFFQTQAIATAIRKLETVPQQRKWHYYFEEWGCMICQSKNERHRTLGMCGACYGRINGRLVDILRRASDERSEQRPARDLQEVARKALRAASSSDGEGSLFVAAGIPPPEVEARPYVTKAERTAHGEKAEKATRDRITAWRAKRARRRETLHQAKALHDEQGLTWREVAQRLDLDFDKNPKAAEERLRIGVYRAANGGRK
jgi:hypothetical protein